MRRAPEADIMKPEQAGSVKMMKKEIATGIQDYEKLSVNQRPY